MSKLSKRVENTVGKGEIAHYEQFLPFPSVFKRLVSQGFQKVSLCGDGLIHLLWTNSCSFHPIMASKVLFEGVGTRDCLAAWSTVWCSILFPTSVHSSQCTYPCFLGVPLYQYSAQFPFPSNWLLPHHPNNAQRRREEWILLQWNHQDSGRKSRPGSKQQTPGMFNPFPNNPWFWRVCSTSVLKTEWEKEKLLMPSKFLLFPQCFLPFLENYLPFSSNSKLSSANSFQFGRVQHLSFGKGLTRIPTDPHVGSELLG